MPAATKSFLVDDLLVQIYNTEAEMAKDVAEIAHRYLHNLLQQQDTVALLLATGNSQLKFLEALIVLDGLDWSRMTLYHLNEYLGIAADHPASFRHYLRERVEKRVSPQRFYYIQGDTLEPVAECDFQKVFCWSRHGKYYLKCIYKNYLNFVPDVLKISSKSSKNDKYLKIIDANTQALQEYNFPPYSGAVTLFRTQDENRTDKIGVKYDYQFGWGEIVTGNLDIYHIPGSHLSLLNEPYVRVVAEQLKECLEKVQINDV